MHIIFNYQLLWTIHAAAGMEPYSVLYCKNIFQSPTFFLIRFILDTLNHNILGYSFSIIKLQRVK